MNRVLFDMNVILDVLLDQFSTWPTSFKHAIPVAASIQRFFRHTMVIEVRITMRISETDVHKRRVTVKRSMIETFAAGSGLVYAVS